MHNTPTLYLNGDDALLLTDRTDVVMEGRSVDNWNELGTLSTVN